MRLGRYRIALTVRHPVAFRHFLDAIMAAGAEPLVQSSPAQVQSGVGIEAVSGLVTDLERGLYGSVESIAALRGHSPIEIPVVFYETSTRPDPLLNEFQVFRFVRVQPGLGADAPEQAADSVRWLISEVPVAVLSCLLEMLFGTLPDTVGVFLRRRLERIAGTYEGSVTAPPPKTSSGLGIARRTLNRHLRQANLPPAKELSDWLLLLYVLFHSERLGTRPSIVARHLGLASQQLCRLRRRLLGKKRPRASLPASIQFDVALIQLVARCRLCRTDSLAMLRSFA